MWGLAVVRGLLVVSEFTGRRLQVLSPKGVPLQVLNFDGKLAGVTANEQRVWVVLEPEPREPTFVRLRGLAFSATKQNVQQWFEQEGAPTPVRISFCSKGGRRSGEAYVELPEMAAERAQHILNHGHMGTKFIEVFVSSKSEVEASQASTATMQGFGDTFVPADVNQVHVLLPCVR